MPSAFTTELPERQLDSRPNFFETNALPRSGIAFVNSRVWSSRLAAGRTGGSRRKAGGEQPQTGVGPLQRPCPDEIRKPRARAARREKIWPRDRPKSSFTAGAAGAGISRGSRARRQAAELSALRATLCVPVYTCGESRDVLRNGEVGRGSCPSRRQRL